jgi:putative hydrolase of the HAD superfamily
MFKTYVLSNINTYHAEWVDKAMRSTSSEHDISQYFDHVFYSHEIGHRKPENEAWQIIIEQKGIDPQKTLFIDDKEENIDAAKALGFIGLHWNPSSDIRSVVDILLPS